MRLFILMLLIPILALSDDKFNFTTNEYDQMKWSVSNSFSDETMLLMDEYSESLIEDYPPESYMLFVLGSQNLMLSAALYNRLGKDSFHGYIEVAPLSRLVEYFEDRDPDEFDKLMDRIIPDQERLKHRKLIIVRLLQSGFNMMDLSGRIKGYLDEVGVSCGFDFYFACNKYEIYEYFAPLRGIVNIRYDIRYANACAFNDYLESTFKYSIYYPVYLDKVDKNFLKNWKGWRDNPLFHKLVDFYKDEITNLRNN